MTLMGTVKNLRGLIIARVFLGMLEAGYFPGVIPQLVWRAFVGASAQSTEKRWEGGASKEINAHLLPLVISDC